MQEIKNHCEFLKKTDKCLQHYIKHYADQTSKNRSELEWEKEYREQVPLLEEKLKKAKPCIRRNCRAHEGDKNLCFHIGNLQARCKRLNSIALTFIETLEQMRRNKLDHITQYLDDKSKLQEIQTDISDIEGDLGELGPCPFWNCDKHTQEDEKQPVYIEDTHGISNKMVYQRAVTPGSQ
ncbi:hypothetical protein HNY73_011325 [Argiope bruennichi]|uniref:Uncharacterized protein n=1 Tax=Argiope bruennichi TaxID=94029 RepID=A0A8T0F5Y4_ARGBR|nr:hypothetical protein HNY73_011325 [Argiope bruennichi]